MIELAQTTKISEKAVQALGQLPPFSPILTRLLAGLADEDVSFSKIAELVEKDTVLAGNVLRLVNSALFGVRGNVTSIRHAISMLGINKLRNVTLSLSVARMWSKSKTPPGWSMSQFNVHSVAVGMLTDLVAQARPVTYAEGAFAAGLFHDLGLLLIAIGLPDEYSEILVRTQQGEPQRQCELEVLGFTHASLSAEALSNWNLPEQIRTAVRYHDISAQDPTPAAEGEVKLSTVVNVADLYANGAGSALAMDGHFEDPQTRLDDLGLGEWLPRILTEFENELTVMRRYF